MASAPSMVRLSMAIVAVVAGVRARAALGEPAGSVSTDQAALAASRGAAEARGSYRVERLISPSRTVREYVSPSGVVFAVAWDGVSHPDLGVVLGAYAAPVRRAVAQERPTPGRRGRRIETAGAVVETWGHMRALHGRAYVPALVPTGVTLDEIR
jgi:hypothetical protein